MTAYQPGHARASRGRAADLVRAWTWCTRGYRGPLLAALAVVVVAQAPYLVGALDPNPILFTSGLNQGGHQTFPGLSSADGNAGITSQANGHRAALDWLHGRAPWWNPYEGTGNVLAAASVSGAMFLPFVLFTLWSDGQLPLYLSLDLIGAGATYALLRRLGARPWACFAGAVLFGLNGTNAWFRFGADNPVAFLPVMLLGVERLRASVLAGGRRGWGLIALGVAMSLLASFPETAYVDGVLVAVWTIARVAVMERDRIKALVRAALGVFTGVLIALPFLVALADDISVANLGAHAGGALGAASVPHQGVLSLFSPYALGPISGLTPKAASAASTFNVVWGNLGGYLTAATLVLALVGLAGRQHRALRLALGALALILVGRIFGVAPAQDLVNLLPGAHSMALYRYADPAVELAVAVLAALGIDDVIGRRVRPWAGAAAGAVVVVLGIAAAHRADGLHHQLSGPHVSGWWDASLLWAGGTVAVIAAGVAIRHRLAAAAIIVLVAVEAVAMFAVPELSSPRGVTVDTAAVRFLQARVGTSRFFSFGGFAPNYGAYFGVASLDISDLPVPESTVRYEQQQLAPDALPVGFDGVTQAVGGPSPRQELPAHLAGYRQAAVDYLIVPHGQTVGDLPAGAVTPVYQDPLLDIYRLAGAAPYASASGGCRATASTRTVVTVDCAHPTTLLRRETMVPGWTASFGGRTITPKASTSGFQLVDVPAGRTVVHFHFEPPHEHWAEAGCLIGLLLLLVAAVPASVADRLGRRRSGPPAGGVKRPAGKVTPA